MVDYKKAFNRQNHSIPITLLGDIGVPDWLLNGIAGFLKERELILSYRGAKSGRKEIVLINSVGFSQYNSNIGERMTQAHNAHKVMMTMHAKYVDDPTVAEALKLKNALNVEKEEHLKRPLNYK